MVFAFASFGAAAGSFAGFAGDDGLAGDEGTASCDPSGLGVSLSVDVEAALADLRRPDGTSPRSRWRILAAAAMFPRSLLRSGAGAGAEVSLAVSFAVSLATSLAVSLGGSLGASFGAGVGEGAFADPLAATLAACLLAAFTASFVAFSALAFLSFSVALSAAGG